MTALIACMKKKDVNLIIGNIIGSNIFNVAFVLGSLGIYNFPIETGFKAEFITLGVISILFLLSHYILKRLNALIGVLFLATYGGVVYYWLNYS